MMSAKNIQLFVRKRLDKIEYDDTNEDATKILESIYDDLEKEGVDSHAIKTIIDNEIIENIRELTSSILEKLTLGKEE